MDTPITIFEEDVFIVVGSLNTALDKIGSTIKYVKESGQSKDNSSEILEKFMETFQEKSDALHKLIDDAQTKMQSLNQKNTT